MACEQPAKISCRTSDQNGWQRPESVPRRSTESWCGETKIRFRAYPLGMFSVARSLAIASALLASGGLTFAQDAPSSDARVITALRLADGDLVRIDGALDEEFWNRAGT